MPDCRFFALLLLILLPRCQATAQYAPEDHWYDNPLGFEPLNLHTSMGVLVPALAVGVGLLLTRRDTALAQRISLYNESGFSWGYKYPYTFLGQNNTGLTFRLRRWMSVGVEVGAYFPHDGFNATAGLLLRPFARFYPLRSERWRLYFESGGGLVYFFDNFPRPTPRDPRLGTYLNGTTKYGLGLEVSLANNMALLAGVRHVHVSNGNTSGAERNPSHDSNGVFLGFSYTF